MEKSKVILVAGAGALMLLAATLWMFGVVPGKQIDVEEAEKLLAAGIALFDEEKYDEALKTLQRVPAGSPQEARVRYYLGSTYMMQKDFDSAAEELQQALVLQPQNTGTLYALGVVYYKLGNLKLSKGYFSSVLEINPNDEHAKGLMDIMTTLERQQPAQPTVAPALPESKPVELDSPQGDSTPATPRGDSAHS